MSCLKLEWIGRYRDLVRELIFYANFSNRNPGRKMNEAVEGISLNKYEYQVLEYVLEHEREIRIQADVSRDLGLLPSVVTGAVRTLTHDHLVERFRLPGNKKSIVLRPTEKGREIYTIYHTRDIEGLFAPFFKALASVPDDQLEKMTEAMHRLNTGWSDFADHLLEKIPEP